MRKWLPLLGLMLLMSATSHAQIVTLFYENFDSATVNMTAETEVQASGAITAGGWSINTSRQVSSPNSYKAVRVAGSTKYLYTPMFATDTLYHARLEFDHICKVQFQQSSRVEYSVDTGNTWLPLPASTYLGVGNYQSTSDFNEVTYANPGGTPYWVPYTNTPTTNNWWAHEVFDLTSVMVDTANPYTHCQIRFVLEDVNPGAGTLEGWYLDNIELTGSSCELQPPVLNWAATGSQQPIGARYQTSQLVSLEVSDAGAGVDSVWLTYSLNGAPDTTVGMTASNTSGCVSATMFSYTIPGLAVGDTVRWYIYAEDCACPNSVRFPSTAAVEQYSTFWIDPAPPIKCGVTTATSWPYIVSNFPFTENFENGNLWAPGSGTGASGAGHRGTWPLGPPPTGRNWQVSPIPSQAGYGWSVRNGPTGTANTGPDGDGTTGNGNYLYTEASQGSAPPAVTSQILTPCFDLPVTSCAVISFKYHMYGADLNTAPVGVLRVDVDTSTGNTSGDYVTLGIITGQNNTSSADGWNEAILSLEEYSGQTISFRIVGAKRTNGDRQDIAIDDLTIYEPDPVDMEMLGFTNPINGLCSYSNAEDIQIDIRSRGCIEQDTIPVSFSVSLNGGTPVVSNDFIYDTLGLGSELNYTYVPKANLSGFGTFEIYAWVDMPGDVDADNDTIGPLIIEHIQPISTFPYVMRFDNSTWVYGGGNINNPGTFGNTDWEAMPPSAQADLSFVIGKEVTEDYNTGPRKDRSGTGQYLYTDVRTPGTNFARYELTRCLDLTTMTNPNVSFWYHKFGAGINFLKLQYQLDGSTQWFDVPGSVVNNTQQTSTVDNWRYKNVDLTAYSGGLIRLRFIVQSTGTSTQTDMAIDDIMIWDESGQSDVGASIVTAPGTSINLDLVNKPDTKVIITNYGRNSVSNIPITVVATDLCDPAATNTVNYTYPGPLAAHSSVEVTLTTSPRYYKGEFSLVAYTNLTGDANTWNDTISSVCSGYRAVSVPYTDDFDSCTYSTAGWFTQGGLRAWEHGVPQKGVWNSAYSSPNSWNLANNFDYQNQTELLRVAPMIGFDTIVGAILRFRHRYNFAGTDGGRLEFRQGGSWNQFGFSSTQVGVNWYDDAGVQAFGGEEAWTGTQPWTLSEFPLSVWDFNANPLQMRYTVQAAANTSGGTGWSIDDFQVVVPPQNSVGPIYADTKEYLVVPNQSATLKFRVQNTGEKTLKTFHIRFRISGINGGAWSQWDTISAPGMFKGRVIKGEFSFPTPVLPPGVYTVDIETGRPVSSWDNLPKEDNRPADDLYSFTLTVSDEVTPTRDTAAYCNDFEDPNKIPLVALHSFNKQLSQEWEQGTPTHPNLNGAHSGTTAWSVDLDSNYSNLAESALHTPFFKLVPDSTYKVSFWHQMNSELYHDGGTFEFSFNGGITWYSLGSVNPDGSWYNTNHVTSLDRLSPGWSGQFGWRESHTTFKVDTPGTAVFRWRFASDYTIEEAGWTIDDFCFNTTSEHAVTGPISIRELEEVEYGMVQLYPNPANAVANLNIASPINTTAKISVNNILGQVMYTSDYEVNIGSNDITLNTESFTNGVYFVQVNMEGETTTLKFVVSHE